MVAAGATYSIALPENIIRAHMIAIIAMNQSLIYLALTSELDTIVKVIDEHEHHSSWAEFIIVGKKLNTKLYRSIDSYLNEPLWYYQLAPIGHKPAFSPFWVAENEICHSDQGDLIDTEDIF